ncbi:acyl-CoA synthetase [Streptomyces sp. NPDC021080]|uniref:acyl-CoA synthetase n=1 Tax=Streptomyces sp. NPDC021080 TaxID=3365110 RepID=UPI00378D03CA
MNLTTLAAAHGDKPAVVMAGSGRSLSYRELEEHSNRIAHFFHRIGLRAGDHIAVLMENQLELFPVVWAAQRSGLFYTPVNWHLSEAETAYIVENCGARVLISSASLEPLARVAAASAPALERRLLVGPGVEGVEELTEVVSGLPADPLPDAVEGYYMFYSSGTTGRPKGIKPELTGEPFGTGLNIDAVMARSFGFGPDSVYLSPGPLYHASPLGWSLGTVRNGGTVVVMERFDATGALEAIQRYGVTHGQFVPTMFVRMLKLPAEQRQVYDVSSLRVVVHAAAPCPVEVKRQMIDWLGPILLEFYAGSEGNGMCIIGSESWLRHPGSVGPAVRGTIHICDDGGVELGPNQVGTIWFGDTARFAYHGDPEKTASAFDERGWSTLGDIGHVDEEGYLYLSDRRTDLILSGGVNIYPREIEDLLTLHPAVADVAVIGLPDPEMGERVHAVVQPADPASVGDGLAVELIAFCRGRMAHYKAPRSVSFEDVPRLPSGKVLRRVLKQRHTDGSVLPKTAGAR